MEEEPRLVAVIAISDDSNEDHWMQAIRHAEVAATEAAVEAGTPEADVTVSVEVNGRVVVVSGPDGRTFEAWVVTDRRIPKASYGSRVDPTGYARPRLRG